MLLILTLISVLALPQKIVSKSIDVKSEYVVKEGDRLWDIASMVKSDEDIRQIIRNIRIANNISSDEFIYPGQKLEIPYSMRN
jgi:LysM repeat protein